MSKKQIKGFTMVELLVVMAIIGVLIATAIWGISVAQQSSRNTQRRVGGSQFVAGFAEFYSRYNSQPKGMYWVAPSGANPGYACLYLITNPTTCNGNEANMYRITLTGITAPAVTGNGAVDLTAASSTVGTNTSSSTEYHLSTLAGNKVCVTLEGGGYSNMSDPQSIACP